jgi:hypothetical protein
MFKCSESSEIGQIMMAGITYVSKGASNQVDWTTDMVEDLVENIELDPDGISTFLAKREC